MLIYSCIASLDRSFSAKLVERDVVLAAAYLDGGLDMRLHGFGAASAAVRSREGPVLSG
jgi:hypothetical protein